MSRYPEHWRLRRQRLRLEGSRCVNCGYPVFPSRPHCPMCATPIDGRPYHRTDLIWELGELLHDRAFAKAFVEQWSHSLSSA
jgi:predicted amidophosphoribosyltransferase